MATVAQQALSMDHIMSGAMKIRKKCWNNRPSGRERGLYVFFANRGQSYFISGEMTRVAD